jgi:hypothetical protein
VAWARGKADSKRDAAQKQQIETLLRRHDREVKDMDRHYHALARLEVRENRSAANAELRQGYRALRERTFALKPEFDKALAAERKPEGGDSGGRRTLDLFNRLAAGIGMSKGDLQAAFERATSGTVKPPDGGGASRTPVDADELERARKLRDDYERLQAGRTERDRDRDR